MPKTIKEPRDKVTGLSPIPPPKDNKATKPEKIRAYEELAAFLLKQYRKNVLQK
jgi:hypothetical protein